ncbi:cytochrome b [Teredinibacter sp. KSP-S5-2]|uniref:cytochrome b n=1 Tax=Teredinibacter sp. KSP-S5-2 TaxID=3034506 RepID=UPI002934C1F3|nr:cytochrome b [Teredinibacter sp. KSP-S5-2]WNO07516.1 cytochrome b [Teredinibacter sp. KSP-S5-2]
MPISDTTSRFGKISIINHWVLALLMISMLAFGLYLDGLPDSPDRGQLIGLHKSFGVLVLILAVWRIAWRAISGFPESVAQGKDWEKTAAKVAHILLLFTLLMMPLSGYIMSEAAGKSVSFFGIFMMPAIPDSELLGKIAHRIHGAGANFVIALIVIHTVAALKHHWIDKDRTMLRMLGK